MKDAETPSAEGVHPFTDKPGKKGQDAKTAAKPVSVTAPIGKKINSGIGSCLHNARET